MNVPCENSGFRLQDSGLPKMFNIWSTDWIHQSLYDANGKLFVIFCRYSFNNGRTESCSFSFLRVLDMSPMEAHTLHISPLIRRRLLAVGEDARELAYAL